MVKSCKFSKDFKDIFIYKNNLFLLKINPIEMTCKICGSNSAKIFEKIILQKYPSGYYQCIHCDFIQTDETIWLKEAYTNAITSLDIGLASRNIKLREEISKIIDAYFPESKIYLDYAGGYGLFTRIMRDVGFDYYRQDDYCENIFANHFDITDTQFKHFDVVTAFEVLEHFNAPLEEIKKVLDYSDTVIFSTEIIPDSNFNVENWWYIAPETGQHIAFYSKKSMQIIAEEFGRNYYCRNGKIHIFTTKMISNFVKKPRKHFLYKYSFFNKKIKRKSFTETDFQYIKDMLNSKTKSSE